mgnify:CR=1 FL=1
MERITLMEYKFKNGGCLKVIESKESQRSSRADKWLKYRKCPLEFFCKYLGCNLPWYQKLILKIRFKLVRRLGKWK